MATHRVNLDALIVREDFAVAEGEGTVQTREPLFKIEELQKDRMYYRVLRKPDFQRTTDNWSPEAIVDCVKSYLDEDLVPALIIWHSKVSGKVFIVDGAHRFSALIAWANDDYGDGSISNMFYNFDIPKAQRTLHKKTKELIEKEVGSFAELYHLAFHGTEADDPVKMRRGRSLTTAQPDMQKVDGSPEKAQRAFLKINSNPAIIDPTDLAVIKARRKPNAIATRALIRAGKGHKYWKFENEPGNTQSVEVVAAETHTLLFGEIEDIGIQTPDVPKAGQPYSPEAFKMVLDMVNIFNNVTDAMWQEPKSKNKKAPIVPQLADDLDGTATLAFLGNVKSAAKRIASNKDGSLGFDPAVYSYGKTGKFHTAAFLASLRFAEKLDGEKRLIAFTTVRALFEDFLVRHKSFINYLGHTKGSRLRALESLVMMHTMIFEKLLESKKNNANISDADIIQHLRTEPRLKGLEPDDLGEDEPENPNTTTRKRFSKTAEAAAIVRDTLSSRARCPICTARYAPFARSKDHILEQERGGFGTEENLQFTHSYCNNSSKQLEEIGFYHRN